MTKELAIRAAVLMGVGSIAIAALLSTAHKTEAHPLGNFTVNRYARLDITNNQVALRYVLDLAEIPAFTEIKGIDKNHDGTIADDEGSAYASRKASELLRGLDVRLAGKRLSFKTGQPEVSFPEGQGGLKTLRLVADGIAPLSDGWQSGVTATVRDNNYGDRLGWREIVIRAGEGVRLLQSSAPAVDRSAELTSYPEDGLKRPPEMREARARFEAGASTPGPTGVAGAYAESKAPARPGDRFAGLVLEPRLTPAFVALSLLAAFAWGAAHALGPGHGKTIVAAYLVGSRGTARHALLLGLTVTATHTSSVILLGLVTLYAARFVAAEDLYIWLSVASGLAVVAMGLALFASRLRRAWWRPVGNHEHVHDHAGGHGQPRPDDDGTRQHGSDHTHSHGPVSPTWRGLMALGISGGLLPCPTALVVMLAAIALDRTAYGLVLILAFSVGLASVLTAIGIALVYAKRLFGASGRLAALGRLPFATRSLQLVPVVSALVILAAGILLTTRAISDL